MKSLALALLFAGIAFADPTAITWTGPATVTYDCCSGTDEGLQPPFLNAVQNGAEADLSTESNTVNWNPLPLEMATIEIPFTITSPAEVAVSVSADYYSSGTDCGDVSCPSLSQWEFYGSFFGAVTITDQNGVDLTVPFSGNGSSAGICDPYQCSGGLTLLDSESGLVDLAPGTYMLTDTYRATSGSVGDSWNGFNTSVVVADPVSGVSAVPEPRIGVLWLGLGLVGMLARRRKT